MVETLVSQTDSAFCATSGKDFSAISGLHSLSEAVLFAALTLFRLISTKHVLTPPDYEADY